MMETSLSQLSETPPSSIAAGDEKSKSRKGSFRSDAALNEADHSPFWTQDQEDFLPELFSENVVAKIWGIASDALWQVRLAPLFGLLLLIFKHCRTFRQNQLLNTPNHQMVQPT